MNLTISGHHLELTPAIREYVQNKLERIKRHFDHVIDIAVILTVDKLPEKEKRQKAEITLHLKGKEFPTILSILYVGYILMQIPS